MGALNLPSAADIERVTRRLRSLSQRLEGIEDAIDRLEERVAGAAGSAADDRLGRIEGAARRDRARHRRAAPSCSRRAASRCRARRNASPSPTPDGRVAGLADADAQLGQLVVGHPAGAVVGRHVAHAEHARRRHPAAGGHLEDRRGLHLHRHGAALGPRRGRVLARVVEEVAASRPSPAARRPPPAAPAARGPARARRSRRARRSCRRPAAPSRRPAACPARSTGRARRRSRSARAVRAPSAISSSHTIAALGPPMPGRLHRERLAVRRGAGVAP